MQFAVRTFREGWLHKTHAPTGQSSAGVEPADSWSETRRRSPRLLIQYGLLFVSFLLLRDDKARTGVFSAPLAKPINESLSVPFLMMEHAGFPACKDTIPVFLPDFMEKKLRTREESATFGWFFSRYSPFSRAICRASRFRSCPTSSSGSSSRSMGPKDRMRISSSVSSSFR